MASTITINVSEKVAQEFRRIAGAVYGSGKGHLGKAIEEAMNLFMNTHKTKSADDELIEMLKKGFGSRGLTYKNRDELYDRD